MKFIGTIKAKRLDMGNKSERDGFVLEDHNAIEHVIERSDDSGYHDSAGLDAFSGKRVRVEGAVWRNVILAHVIEEL